MAREPGGRVGVGVTTWVVALVFVAAVAAGGAFSALVRYDMVGFGHLPRAAVFVCWLMIGVNAVWSRCTGRRVLEGPQLVALYLAILVMSGFPGTQLATFFYIGLIGAQHHATAENRWQDTFLGYLPEWMVPSKDPDSPAIRYAFYGVPPGGHLPWHDWVGPLLWWTPYIAATLMMGATLAAALRRRWVDEEHLLFPLAQIPLEMLTYDRPRAALPAVAHSGLFWACFAIPVLVFSKNALHYYVPAVPLTNLTPNVGVVFGQRPWSELNWFPYHWYFEMMGITYLVADDVAFSLWSFWVMRWVLAVARASVGLGNHGGFYDEQGMGAYVVLALVYLWTARHTLARTVRAALGAERECGGSREPMGAPWIAWGFVGSVVVIVVFGHVGGAAWWTTLAMVAVFTVTQVAVSRVVAEAGVFAVWTPLDHLEGFATRVLGADLVGARAITVLSYMGWKIRTSASMTTVNLQHAYKLEELAGLKPRDAGWLIGAALGVALVATHIPALVAIYGHTVPALGWWPRLQGPALGDGINWLIQYNPVFRAGSYGNMLLGAVMVLGLNWMRQRYLWWPFHPLAYTAMMGPQFMGDRYGFSVFLGWLGRRAVQNLGGHKAYHKGRAAAVGLIAGNAVVLLAWSIVHYFRPIAGVLIIE